jgi:cytidylate kinase
MAVPHLEGIGAEVAPETNVFHGYRGPEPANEPFTPPLTIVINRQTGARGRAVAERVAELLGFTFISPESLELFAEDPLARSRMDDLPAAAEYWVEERKADLAVSSPVATHPEMLALVRVILEIGAAGSSVLMGKGASAVLPSSSTLNARLVAPEVDRIAYVAQWERLSPEAAAQYVSEREEGRRQYMLGKFGIDPETLDQYSLLLNTSDLGVETCSQLIALAARTRIESADDLEDGAAA